MAHHPQVFTQDATAAIPGTYGRIVSMVSVPRVPASWLRALRPGGRLVTTLAGTGLILTADKNDDGATGRIEWDRASFMATRTSDDYPPQLNEFHKRVSDLDGEEVTTSPFPVLDVMQALEEWAARRDGRRPTPGDRKAVPLGEGPEHGGHVDPDAPRGMLEWDGHQWTPRGVADDHATAVEETGLKDRAERVPLPRFAALPRAPERPFRPAQEWRRP